MALKACSDCPATFGKAKERKLHMKEAKHGWGCPKRMCGAYFMSLSGLRLVPTTIKPRVDDRPADTRRSIYMVALIVKNCFRANHASTNIMPQSGLGV
jgi:hypothetical protein